MNIKPATNYGHDLALVKPACLVVGEIELLSPEFVVMNPSTKEIEFKHSGQDNFYVRSQITMLQRKMDALPDKSELKVEHEFCDGMYMRKLYIPKGTIIVGKVHKQPCHNICASGDISILTESGAKRVKSGFSSWSPAGIQKLGYANEDTVFINVFRTNETDVSAIEETLAWESFDSIPVVIQGGK